MNFFFHFTVDNSNKRTVKPEYINENCKYIDVCDENEFDPNGHYIKNITKENGFVHLNTADEFAEDKKADIVNSFPKNKKMCFPVNFDSNGNAVFMDDFEFNANPFSSRSPSNLSTEEKGDEKYHPLFGHGSCKWPGCELIFDELPAFLK